MITTELAAALRSVGLAWNPRSGDRFVIPDHDLDGEVFVISEMTIEAQSLEHGGGHIGGHPGGKNGGPDSSGGGGGPGASGGGVVRFNGTTEWALDSIEQSEVLWLPDEAQMRELLGARFVALEATEDGFVVQVRSGPGSNGRHADPDAACAYAKALLAVLPVLVAG